MRTLLSQFCEEFERTVRPLIQPLTGLSNALDVSAEDVPAREVLPELRDLAHQLKSLADKVEAQQAYVLIFGPLKSGKSTLMNSVCATYVSEVTALPAYPCMVFVSHSETREFTVTRYNGQAETFGDPAKMRLQINRAHVDLAGKIREVEERGESFDPVVHFPEAIRRVDVKVPAGHLEQSGAVLVDTPGLYSRMKFGYDRMTREFRNTAACAIFVVKSDNLFLEQVFEEFNQLLALFSRIFLVVNLDTNKKDLRADGSLVPSLEREDPLRIIEAFESLAMSAPLKAALEEGRLRIYPVDLLRAASLRILSQNTDPSRPEDFVNRDATPEEDVQLPALELDGQADFDTFMSELTEYLNSTEYLVAFLGDSLRHARSLLGEAGDVCDRESVRKLARDVEQLETERQSLVSRQKVLERVKQFDWSALRGRMQEDLAQGTLTRAREIEDKTSYALQGSLDEWFQSDASLQEMTEDSGPLLASFENDLKDALRGALGDRVREQGHAGLEVPEALKRDLATVDVPLSSIGHEALEALEMPRSGRTTGPGIGTDAIPVRKSIWDWLTLRTQAKMRRKLFGPADRPTRKIPKVVKTKRLGSAGREAMWSHTEEFLSQFFPERSGLVEERVFGRYTEQVLDDVQVRLADERQRSDERLAELDARLAVYGDLHDRLTNLQAQVTTTQAGISELQGKYGETDPDLLVMPVPPPVLDKSPSQREAAEVETTQSEQP